MSSEKAGRNRDSFSFSASNIPSWAESWYICVYGYKPSSYSIDVYQAISGRNDVPAVSVDIDIRTQTEKSDYFLIFSAADTKYGFRDNVRIKQHGHAWATWATYDNDARQTRVEAKGMYPANYPQIDNVFYLSRGVPGDLRDDAIGGNGDADERFAVRLNRRTYEDARRVQADWQTGTYQLLRSDCVSFIDAVADAIGLDTPSRLSNPTPQGYVRALARAND